MTQEGGATKRQFDAIEDLYVDTEAQQISLTYTRSHYDDWVLGLEQQSGFGIEPEKRLPLKGLKDIQKFIEQNYRVVIFGEPGAGKTSLLERLFIEYSKIINQENALIPVLLRLSSFDGKVSFKEFIIEQLGMLANFYEVIEERLILLCNTLNEMPYNSYESDKRSLIDEVRLYLENEASKWVLSCRVRDYVSVKLGRVGRNVKRVQIMPLDPPQIKRIIDLRSKRKPEIGRKLWNEISGENWHTNMTISLWEKFSNHDEAIRFWDWKSAQATISVIAAPQYITGSELAAWRTMHEKNLCVYAVIHIC